MDTQMFKRLSIIFFALLLGVSSTSAANKATTNPTLQTTINEVAVATIDGIGSFIQLAIEAGLSESVINQLIALKSNSNRILQDAIDILVTQQNGSLAKIASAAAKQDSGLLNKVIKIVANGSSDALKQYPTILEIVIKVVLKDNPTKAVEVVSAAVAASPDKMAKVIEVAISAVKRDDGTMLVKVSNIVSSAVAQSPSRAVDAVLAAAKAAPEFASEAAGAAVLVNADAAEEIKQRIPDVDGVSPDVQAAVANAVDNPEDTMALTGDTLDIGNGSASKT